MSEAFSGQTTRSGRGRVPAATSAAASSVAVTWLSRTWRRSALKSRPGRGTLPWTAMTLPGAPSVGSGTANPGTRTTTAPARAAGAADGVAGHAERRRPGGAPSGPHAGREQAAGQRHREGDGRRAAERGQAPERRVGLAERQPDPGEAAVREAGRAAPPAPPRRAPRPAAGPAGRAPDRGPEGTRWPLRAERRRAPGRRPGPAHGTTPTTMPAQLSEYPKKTRPVTRPSRNPVRARAPQVARASRATPTGASGQMS